MPSGSPKAIVSFILRSRNEIDRNPGRGERHSDKQNLHFPPFYFYLIFFIIDEIDTPTRKERFIVPEFPNPFAGNVDRKVSKEELVQALRIDIAGELEAMFLYDAHAQATDDPLVRKVLMDIRDEEKAHVGELMALLRYLEPNWAEFLAEGDGEVREMMEELGITPSRPDSAPTVTVGSLIEK